MADSNITILDSTGTTRNIDTQLVGSDHQQTVITNLANTSVLTNVTSSITSVTIVAANANRRGTIIFNDSTAVLSITYGSGASSATSFTVKVQPAAAYFLDVPLWTGAITGIWAAANGFARVTDISA